MSIPKERKRLLDQFDGTALTLSSESSHSEQGAIGEFVRAAVRTAAEEPIRGVAQLIDRTGTHTDEIVQSGFSHIISRRRLRSDYYGSAAWYGQLGGAVGMMLPYLILHKGVKFGASKALGDEVVYKSPLETGIRHGLLNQATTDAGIAGTTGLNLWRSPQAGKFYRGRQDRLLEYTGIERFERWSDFHSIGLYQLVYFTNARHCCRCYCRL